MKNLKKLVTIAISMAMVSSIFTGCSSDAKSLSNALTKTQKVTSSEFKTEIGVRVSADNLSAQEQQEVNKAIPMINASKMTANGKMIKGADMKTGKMQADVAMQLGTMPVNMGVWVDASTVNDKLAFKEIVKVPDVQSAKMGGKQYIVLDSSKMSENNAMNMDFIKANKDMQKKLSEVIVKNMASFDPNSKLITDKGYQSMNLPDGSKNVHVFEVKLNDKNFKDLIKYSSNNLVNNKEIRELIKEYSTTVMKASANKEQITANQAEIDKSFLEFEKSLPEFTTKMNKTLTAFDGVTLVGDKGIVIDYAVDNNGYIVNEKGNIDLVFDAPKFIAAVESLNTTNNTNATTNKLTGIYKLGIDFNVNTFNINKNVDVQLPEVNSENSIQYQDLINQTTAKKN